MLRNILIEGGGCGGFGGCGFSGVGVSSGVANRSAVKGKAVTGRVGSLLLILVALWILTIWGVLLNSILTALF